MATRKQHLSHDDFLRLREAARAIPQAVLERRIDQATALIRQHCAGRVAAYAWSGGKDSQALRLLAEAADVTECVMGISDLEYPAFLRWATDHMPARLAVINTGVDIEWLARHQDQLFPPDAKTAAAWFHRIQHRAQSDYCRRNRIDVLLLGRRRQDGNFVGRGGDVAYVKDGVTLLSPIADWTHGEVFAAIDRFGLDLPPFYDWPRGFRCGTHCWAARQWCPTPQDGWAEVHTIDAEIAPWAALYLDSARTFLAQQS